MLAATVVACGGGESATPSSTSSSAPSTSVVPSTTEATATTSTTTTGTTLPPPVLVPSVEVTGPAEVVFDWDVDACEPEHIPDIAARAFRDDEGRVQLSIGHYVNYRMVGPSLDEVAVDCSGPTLVSTFDPDPSHFDDSVWIGGVHTDDGETVHAVVHHEYRGDTHAAARPDQCPSGVRFTCLDTSLTMYVSRDGGDSFVPLAEPPGHLAASLPYVFDDEGVPSGLRQPSNIIDGRDGHYYVFSNVSDYPAEEQWVCAMRTDDLDDPAAWRYWTGAGFDGEFVDPYAAAVDGTEKCAPLARPQLGVGVQEAVVFDETLGLFVAFGTEFAPGTAERAGVYYSTSPDLVEWSSRRLLVEHPAYASVSDPEVDGFQAYVSVLDPDSPSMSFDTSDGRAYLYMTRFNAGSSSLDRDLLRWPISFALVEAEAPEWTFDGVDPQGWAPIFDVGPLTVADGHLGFATTGDDPHLGVALSAPAEFGTLRLRLRVEDLGGATGEDQAQVFFGTDDAPDFTESASVVFPVVTDGEFHEYELDMAGLDEWRGTIVTLRLDPGSRPDVSVEIDWIELSA